MLHGGTSHCLLDQTVVRQYSRPTGLRRGTMRLLFAGLMVIIGGLPLAQVRAQEFPSKPMHMMVGAAPGGLIDLFART
jgi:hypothetical protein